MHNDDTKHGVRLFMMVALLLSGVVCGSAVIGTKETTRNLVLPDLNNIPRIQIVLDQNKEADQTETTSQIVADLPNNVSEDDTGSAGYQIVMKAVREELRASRPSYALKILEKDPLAQKLKNSEFDRIKAQIAQSYLIEGKIDRAGIVAGQAVERSESAVPLAAWVAGQAAWRNNDFKHAKQMFAICAKSNKASSWLASGGAYWAARSATRLGDDESATKWHEYAANYPRTFYGLISMRAIDRDFPFNWNKPDLSSSDKKKLGLDLKVSAALRLSRDGELSAAITTLSSSEWIKNNNKRRALLAYFQYKNDPALTLFLAKNTHDKNGRLYDDALYPDMPWKPKGGYSIDEAIIHALIRQESRFNPNAVSSVGAIGLMQLMPATAAYVSGESDITLSHPETNIEIGQKYVKQLLADKAVNNNLFKMAVAYNAGPGSLSRWTKELKNIDDVMVFIESIPSSETRAFVERVMFNYWMYSLKNGAEAPSLDAVAFIDKPDVIRTARNKMNEAVAMLSNGYSN